MANQYGTKTIIQVDGKESNDLPSTSKQKPTATPELKPTKVGKLEIVASVDIKGFNVMLDRAYNIGQQEAFQNGIKAIVTLAESYLAQSLKLSRDELSKDSRNIPAWWVATLVQALHYKLPDTSLAMTKEIGNEK